ncbi:MAG: PEP/pyruvate-binding domain-containing protein [Candidatus Jacksonbacteria bacterium]
MSKFIQPFFKLNKNDVALAGGKGASLGELTRIFGGQAKAGFPVPEGFVITAQAFEKFLIDTDLYQDIQSQLNKINYQDTNSVDRYSNVIRDMIWKTEFPDDLARAILSAFKKLGARYVAVRSSATAEDSKNASWAGELETYLNTTKAVLIDNVKKCWSSLFTPRAIFYRHEKKLLDSKISVAVIIQKMIQSEVSGICFTVHPVTKDKNQMIIEAGFGLGEAIVSGQITPDSYVVDKLKVKSPTYAEASAGRQKVNLQGKSKKSEVLSPIIDINVSEQERMLVRKGQAGNIWEKVPQSQKQRQKLNNQQIIELARMCVKIENHYKSPQDIEWAWSGGQFYITQSRPITTLGN